jgi:chromosome segregation ATPase
MSKRSRLVYDYDESRSHPQHVNNFDPFNWLTSVLQKRDGMIARAVKHKLKNKSFTPPNDNLEIQRLRKINEELRCSNKKLSDEVLSLKNKLASTVNQHNADIESNLLLCKKELLDAHASIDKLQSQINVYKENLTTLEKDHVSVNESLSASQQIISTLEKNCSGLQDKVKRLKKQNSQAAVDTKVSNLNLEINNLRDENILLEKRVTHSENLLRDKVTKLVELHLEKNKLVEHIKLIEKDYSAQFDKVNTYQADLTLRYKKYVNMEKYKYWKCYDAKNRLLLAYRIYKWIYFHLQFTPERDFMFFCIR